MSNFQSLTHSKWDCKYNVVFIPKFRRKQLFGQRREYLCPVFYELARHKECKIIEGHLMPDHVHMCITIPPKHAIAKVMDYIKGKSAISVARQFSGKKRNFSGERLWTSPTFAIFESENFYSNRDLQ